jgi:hypothetical protein
MFQQNDAPFHSSKIIFWTYLMQVNKSGRFFNTFLHLILHELFELFLIINKFLDENSQYFKRFI